MGPFQASVHRFHRRTPAHQDQVADLFPGGGFGLQQGGESLGFRQGRNTQVPALGQDLLHGVLQVGQGILCVQHDLQAVGADPHLQTRLDDLGLLLRLGAGFLLVYGRCVHAPGYRQHGAGH